jgi:MraZ protein
MVRDENLILGEERRTLDERFRLSIPAPFTTALGGEQATCILAKERLGCLSLWNRAQWQERFDPGLDVIRGKLRAGKLDTRTDELQLFARLLSTRHMEVSLAGRARLLIPDGFRDFLRVEPGGELLLIGAAVCLEIWNPTTWLEYLENRMPKFRKLFDRLTG